MAYGNRFRFRFMSVHGVEYNIYILKEGYTGVCDQRPLGRAPVLKKKKNGPIYGTSLELYAQCNVDNNGVSEYAELYTSDPWEYMVKVFKGSNTTPLWVGYVCAELFSAPSIAPPYDVQIVATDGLGELKLSKHSAQGELTLIALLNYLLNFTGYERDFLFATDLYEYDETSPTRDGILTWLIDVDFLAGKSIYDVLTYILDSLHATISLYGNNWFIAREVDINTLFAQDGGLSVIHSSAQYATIEKIYGTHKSVGKMGVADMWPIGYLSEQAVPAKKQITVSSPWQIVEMFANPEMRQAQGGWTLSTGSFYIEGSVLERPGHGGIYIGCAVGYPQSSVSQSFQIDRFKFPLKVTVNCGNRAMHSSDVSKLYVLASYATAGTTWIYSGEENGWNQSGGQAVIGPPIVLEGFLQLQEQTIIIPNPNIGTSGTLTVTLLGENVWLDSAHLTQEFSNKGYKCVVHINNDARGEGEGKEILHGYITPSVCQYVGALNGAFKKNILGAKTYIYYFNAPGVHYIADFLLVQALSRATSVAEVRVKTTGIIDIPSSYVYNNFPLMIRQGQRYSWLETWEWNLRDDEAKIEALSLPSASIYLDVYDIEPIPDK